jgi:ATP-dependent Zn protease
MSFLNKDISTFFKKAPKNKSSKKDENEGNTTVVSKENSSEVIEPLVEILSKNKAKKKKINPNLRRPISTYDRVKVFMLLGIIYGVLVFTTLSENPLYTLTDAAKLALINNPWLVWVLGFEIIRQIHFILCEKSETYWRIWNKLIYFIKKPFMKLSAYTRFRLGRMAWFLSLVILGAFFLGSIMDESPGRAYLQAFTNIWSSLPLFAQFFAYILLIVAQFGLLFWFLSKGGVEVLMPEEVKTTFDDVWGQDQVVAKVKETLDLLEEPDLIESRGGYVPSGILLWGPPGTGKTLMAEALAGETGKPFVMVEPGAFQAMFLGINILKVKGLYRKLRKLALRYDGVVVFFDEADVLGKRPMSVGQASRNYYKIDNSCLTSQVTGEKYGSLLKEDILNQKEFLSKQTDLIVVPGGGGGGGGDLGTLNAILASMQGLKKPRGITNKIRRLIGLKPAPAPKYRILHVMATNMPDSLDDALLRPGRIDRIFKVGYPNKEGRVRTYWGYLGKVKNSITPEEVDRLATSSPYASGAVIKDIVNEALMSALRDGRETITWGDIVSAKRLKEYGVTDGFQYTDKDRHAIAIHEACHAIAAFNLKKNFQIDIATIERRGSTGGFVSRVPTAEKFGNWRSDLEEDIQISIASIVGERMFFDNDNTDGVSNDLANATRIALHMEASLGMGETIAAWTVLTAANIGGEMANSETLLGLRVESRLRELYDKTKELLEKHKEDIIVLAHSLEVHKTLNGADVEAVIYRKQGPLVDGSQYLNPEFLNQIYSYMKDVKIKGNSVVNQILPPGHTIEKNIKEENSQEIVYSSDEDNWP